MRRFFRWRRHHSWYSGESGKNGDVGKMILAEGSALGTRNTAPAMITWRWGNPVGESRVATLRKCGDFLFTTRIIFHCNLSPLVPHLSYTSLKLALSNSYSPNGLIQPFSFSIVLSWRYEFGEMEPFEFVPISRRLLPSFTERIKIVFNSILKSS